MLTADRFYVRAVALRFFGLRKDGFAERSSTPGRPASAAT
jgi:hypothetical protein